MRLVFVSFIESSPTSGMGMWTHRVASELRGAGHQVDLWFTNDFKHLALFGRLGRQVFPVELAVRLVQRRQQFDVAVVHEPSAFYFGFVRRMVPSLPGLLVVSHGVETRAFKEMTSAARYGLATVSLASRIRHRLLRGWQSDGALRFGDRVLCLSEVDREYLQLELGISPEKIHVAINGTDELGPVAVHGSLRVVAIGSWIQEKGSVALPRIWERVLQTVPRARLCILGTNREAEHVRGAFPELSRASIEVVPQYSGEKQLAMHARGASVFLLSSLREGSPIALLEAMSLGLAPVASSVGGVPEILSGALKEVQYDRFDLQRAAQLVTGMLLEPERAAHVSALARSRAQELTWKKTASLVESACLQVLSQ